MNTATQQGASRDYVTNAPSTPPPNPDLAINEVVVRESPRDISIAAMTERMEANRTQELQEAIEADPGLAANQARIDNQIEAANKEAIESGELQPPVEDPDGAASIQPMHTPPAEPKPDALPADMAADPLSEYIVMQDGKPMFSTKVNGQLRLIPLEDARRELQIGTAAAIRMNEATRLHQQVTERAEAVSANEAALAQRVATAPALPAVPAQSDLTEEDLLEEAKDIFNTAFTGTEEDAARKLAKTLVKLRGSVTAPAAQVQPRVDEGAIVRKAAQAAVGAIQSVEKTKDVRSGYVKFQEDYPDVMNDPALYKMADDMTDGIERENPTWPISQVMDEAGKRTRAWVNKLKGVEPDPPDPLPQPGSQSTGVPPQPPTQAHRQDRKSELVRIPTVASAAVHEQPSDVVETEQSPQEAFAELKQSRGQPT